MTADERTLPQYAAGSMHIPFVIARFSERVERDTHWAEHSHPTHELTWNEHGASTVTVASRTWTITPGRGIWMPAGVLHSGTAPAGTGYHTSHFGVDAVTSISDVPVAVEITPLLRLLLERLAEDALAPESRRLTEALVLDTLAPSTRELFVHRPDSALLAPIVAAVEQSPGSSWSLARWAEQLGVSTRTITRAFRAETGIGFVGWVATVRAQRAVAMLVRGEDIAGIAEHLGYSSPSAFGAALRRTTGFTPSAFRPR